MYVQGTKWWKAWLSPPNTSDYGAWPHDLLSEDPWLEDERNCIHKIFMAQTPFLKLPLFPQGRGCTYSYCTKFQRCSTCSQDAACGWCDSLQQCVPGTATGPYAGECPDWFYYTCYTIGSDNHCSNKIQVKFKPFVICALLSALVWKQNKNRAVFPWPFKQGLHVER